MLKPSWISEDDDNLNRFNSIDLYATDDEDFDDLNSYPSSDNSIDDQEN